MAQEWELPTGELLARERAEESGDWDLETESWEDYVERLRDDAAHDRYDDWRDEQLS